MIKEEAKGLALIVGVIVAALVAGVVFWFVFVKPAADRQAAAQAGVNSNYSAADARSADAATGAVASLGERNQARDELSRGTADAINSLPGAALPVDPAVHAAGRQRNCLRDAYRDSPACRGMRPADPAAAPR